MYSWVGKKEFVNLGLNIKEGCYCIKVLFTSLILLEMKQCEHGPYTHQDGRDLKDLLHYVHVPI